VTFEAAGDGILTVKGVVGGEHEKENLFHHLNTNKEIRTIEDHLKVGILSNIIF